MVKKLSITISNKTYKDYIQNYKGNKSEFIEENFLIGVETQTSELPQYKTQLLNLKKENRQLIVELNKYKSKSEESEENKEKKNALKKRVAFVKGIKNAGMI